MNVVAISFRAVCSCRKSMAPAAAALLFTIAHTSGQGSLTPPGPPAPVFKTLHEVEPRTPIGSIPYVIASPGSYYVVSNLYTALPTNGITIIANDVTLDLNGFTLFSGNTGLNGVFVSGPHRNIVVKNGTVRNWAGDGINLTAAVTCEVRDVKANQNGGNGITTDDSSIISRCIATVNGAVGISAGNDSNISDSIATDNRAGFRAGDNSRISDSVASLNHGGDGFNLRFKSIIERCRSIQNAGHGISSSLYAVVSHCIAESSGSNGIVTLNDSTLSFSTAVNNGNFGISGGQGSTVKNCVGRNNRRHGFFCAASSHISESTASQNGEDGINVSIGTYVLANNCRANGTSTNGGAGISVTGSDNRIDGNNVSANTRGIEVLTGGNLIIRNSAASNGTNAAVNNFSFIGLNTAGPIQTTSGTITNLNPWANFSF